MLSTAFNFITSFLSSKASLVIVGLLAVILIGGGYIWIKKLNAEIETKQVKIESLQAEKIKA